MDVFIMADDLDDARGIEALNDAEAAAIKLERDQLIARSQVVEETSLPDVRREELKVINEARERSRQKRLERFLRMPSMADFIKEREAKPPMPRAECEKVTAETDHITVRTERFDIDLAGSQNKGHIKIDDVEMRGVTKMTIVLETGKLPSVTMELAPIRPEGPVRG